MADYKKMYLKLFNAVTDAINELDNGETAYAKYKLMKAQAETEDVFIETEPDIYVKQEGKIIKIR